MNEAKIMMILKKYNIEHKFQHWYKDLIGLGGGHLKYDFYIPSKNLLIEYDGAQHYGKLNLGKHTLTIKEYEKLKVHDKLKNEYAEKNNIDLLRIPYWEHKNIKHILGKKLNINI